MVQKLAAAHLKSGEPVLFEFEDVDDSGVTAVSISVTDAGIIDLERALGGVKHAAGQVLDTIRSIASPPDSCEISFGVKLVGSVGAIIAKASTEANFTIKMVWNAGGKS